MQDSPPTSRQQDTFKDPTALTRWTQVFLWVGIASNLAAIWVWISGRADGAVLPGGFVSADPFLPHLIWYFPVQWITAILVLTWVHRANYNARQLGAVELEFTPLWAVGSYLVPVVWFWMPFRAMKEIWQASSSPLQWRREPGSGLVDWWWALWITAFSAWIVDEVIIQSLSGMEAFMGWAGIISPCLEIPAALLLLVIASRVHGMQMEHYRSPVATGGAQTSEA